ncbi:MAG: acetolactate synthase large subunit [Candidatus Jacksonbacteria bacterium]|nr:acetolactate synthase large subunit [Candidatus Jacksonbacteria bacterium]
MKSSDLLIKCLENEGVKLIFGVPGEETLDILESLRSSSIQFITTRGEQAAAFMAATCGRLTGRAGVVLTTLGPGATNLATGLAYANLGGFPLVAITGQKPIKQTKQGRFQQVNIVRLAEPITKMSRRIESAEKIPVLVSRAFRHAETERPGAVLLEIPEDIARDSTGIAPIPSHRLPITPPHPSVIREAGDIIRSSRLSIIIIGADAKRWNIENELSAFIGQTHFPFITTPLGKGAVAETHPNFLGTAATTDGELIHDELKAADAIIAVGHTTFEKPPCIPNNARQRIIHINTTPSEISHIYQPTVEVVGDVACSLRDLARALENFQRDANPFEVFANFQKTEDNDTGSAYPFKPEQIARALQKTFHKESIIALDNGLYKLALAKVFRALWAHHLLLDNTLATMGAGLPSAIAAKIVHPDRKVIALCGDGGFMMNSQELETARRLGLDLLVIVLNDNAFGMIRVKQSAMGFPEFGLKYGNPDFVKYAESYGARGYRLSEGDDLADTMAKLVQEPGITLLEIPIEYSN